MSKEEKKTIHARMAEVKKELSEREIRKSGHNEFADFKYHELNDCISHINELNLKHGVNDIVEINESEGLCKITLINVDDSEDKYSIVTPYREAEMLSKGGKPSTTDAIQRMGSTITYNRRYLYMTAYNIQEHDGVDSQEPGNGTKKKPAQPAKKKPAQPAKKKDFSKPFGEVIQAVLDGDVTSDAIIEQFNTTEQQRQELKEAYSIRKK